MDELFENKHYTYETYNQGLLNAMPAGCAHVLEVGCSGGALGAAYKQANPGCAYYGVELTKAAAAHAATQLDMVLCGPVDQMDLSFLTDKLDCIVYGDVLEHLVDPWAVLKSHAKLLSKTGVVTASIPNVQHWSLLDHVMRGHWNYSDYGILDNTHLRFFTLNTIQRLFVDAGLKIDHIFGFNVHAESATRFTEALRPGLENLGIDVDDFCKRIMPLQYVVTASRTV
jgi:2-polyprenyl-3-methyl-5-hydroxy-6-metoxy-1,4-benzoquinol methylase